MKKKYYRYLLYSILLIGTAIALAYVLGVSPLQSLLFSNSTSTTRGNLLNDSLIVIKLNRKAFNSRLTDPKKTIQIAGTALKLAKRIDYSPGIAEAYRVSGVGFSYLENNSLATKNYIEALRCYKQLNDNKNIARTYSNIGNLYKYNHPDKALNYFNKALKIAGNIRDEEIVAGMHFNIALIYSRKAEYYKSLIYFDKSYSIFNKLKDTVSKVIYLQNTGRIYHQLKKTDLAISRLTTAIKTAKDLKLYTTIGGCYLSLAYIYLEQSELNLAEKAIAEGLIYSQKLKDSLMGNDLIRAMYELELKRKNYPKALKYLSLAYHNDSLLLNENQSSNIEINSQYYLQQQKIQEKELIITEQKYRAATTRWIITLGILGVLLSVMAVLIWHFLRERKRKKDEIVIQSKITLLEQKALQAMMNPHFIFNVMTSIQHFINQSDAKTASQLLSGFARLTRKHLEMCMNSTISVHEELVYLQLYISLEKIRFPDKMNYEITIDKNIETEEIIIPSMLIQPFLENAIWHGIVPKEEGGVIKLKFDLHGTDLLISIVDDGIGILNSSKIKKTGHISRGLALIHERVALLNRLNKRHIFINQQQTGEYGTEVLIQIPV